MDLLYFALLCSVLIFVHELGHLLVAKAFGVKVLTFSIGFGPKILRIRGRDTEYCVGILPIGGFVKMLEENRQEAISPDDAKRTFDAQPLYRRALIVLAGPLMNIVFPILLYFSVFAGQERFAPPTVGTVLLGHPAEGKLLPGDRVLTVDGDRITTFSELRRRVQKSPGQELRLDVFRNNERIEVSIVPEDKVVQRPLGLVDHVGEIGIGPHRTAAVIGVGKPDSPAFRAGLRTFDVVAEVRGRPVRTYADLASMFDDNRGETVPVTYLRPVVVPAALGGLADMAVYESGVAALTPEVGHGELLERTGIEPADLYVAHVDDGSAEQEADLRPGDRIVELDQVEVKAWSSLLERLHASPERPHVLTWLRGGVRKSGTVELRREDWIDETGETVPRFFVRATNWSPTVPEAYVDTPPKLSLAFAEALDETYDVARFIAVGFVRIVEGKVSLSTLGGPITVYDVIGEEGAKGASYFVWAMAVISINLGLLNLLPIPILDGGHLVFLFFEALFKKPLPLRAREVLSLVGLFMLLLLMGVAMKNDLERRWGVIEGQVEGLVDP